jgi:hypothetical protein
MNFNLIFSVLWKFWFRQKRVISVIGCNPSFLDSIFNKNAYTSRWILSMHLNSLWFCIWRSWSSMGMERSISNQKYYLSFLSFMALMDLKILQNRLLNSCVDKPLCSSLSFDDIEWLLFMENRKIDSWKMCNKSCIYFDIDKLIYDTTWNKMFYKYTWKSVHSDCLSFLYGVKK